MNQTAAVIGGIILIAIVAGFAFYAMNMAPVLSPVASSTPIVVGTNDPNPLPIQAGTPGAPVATTNTTVAPTDTTVVVTGSVIPNGVFTSYWYEYGTTSALGSKTPAQTIGSGYSLIPSPAYITGLTKSTAYYYRVVAENQFGKVTGTQNSFLTTQGIPPPVGSAPNAKTISASSPSQTTVNLNGEITSNKNITQYWFEYGVSTNLGNTTAFASVGDGVTNVPVSQSISSLAPATTYYYRINAQNQFGTVNGAILSFKTLASVAASAPSADTNDATSVSTSTATLNGIMNANGTDTSYWFEYSANSLLGAALLKTTSHQSIGSAFASVPVSADITGLDSKTNYYFKLVTQNSLGTVRGNRETFKTK